VLHVDPARLPQKGAEPPIFGLCLLWPNGWMDQDGTWYEGRPRPRLHCVTWGLSPPIFGPRLLWPNGRSSQLLNIWQSYRQDGCFTHSVRPGTVLHNDEEFAINFTHDMNQLLLTVNCCFFTSGSPLILTLQVTNNNLITPIF